MNIETKITVKKIYNHNLVSKGSKKAQVLNDSCFNVTKLKPVSVDSVIFCRIERNKTFYYWRKIDRDLNKRQKSPSFLKSQR